MSDIVEDLQRCRRSGELAPLFVLDGAIDAIKSLRYDHERDVEKIAALNLEIESLRRYLGMAVDKIADYDLREATRDMPHPIHHQSIWTTCPHCGSTESAKFETLVEDQEHIDGGMIATLLGLRCHLCGTEMLFRPRQNKQIEAANG